MRFSEDCGPISNAVFRVTQMYGWSPSIIVSEGICADLANALCETGFNTQHQQKKISSFAVNEASMRSEMRKLPWQCGDQTLQLGGFPLIMGIVNVTPDSFSDGGNFLERNAAVDHALKLADNGADILDIGGESTRPNAERVSVAEELRRVVDVVAQVRQATDRLISIDTTKAEVARQALAAGANIVNDISGLTFEPGIVDVCAESDCGVICMHILGTPQTMQGDPHYENVVSDVCDFLSTRLARWNDPVSRVTELSLIRGSDSGRPRNTMSIYFQTSASCANSIAPS